MAMSATFYSPLKLRQYQEIPFPASVSVEALVVPALFNALNGSTGQVLLEPVKLQALSSSLLETHQESISICGMVSTMDPARETRLSASFRDSPKTSSTVTASIAVRPTPPAQ
jgi:hypothetical protein